MKPVATERFPISVITGVNTDRRGPISVITGVNTDRRGFNTGAGQDIHHNFLL